MTAKDNTATAAPPPLSVRQLASRDLDIAVQEIDAALTHFTTAQRIFYHSLSAEVSDRLRGAFNIGQG